jgi:hypothetical protein
MAPILGTETLVLTVKDLSSNMPNMNKISSGISERLVHLYIRVYAYIETDTAFQTPLPVFIGSQKVCESFKFRDQFLHNHKNSSCILYI